MHSTVNTAAKNKFKAFNAMAFSGDSLYDCIIMTSVFANIHIVIILSNHGHLTNVYITLLN